MAWLSLVFVFVSGAIVGAIALRVADTRRQSRSRPSGMSSAQLTLESKYDEIRAALPRPPFGHHWQTEWVNDSNGVPLIRLSIVEIVSGKTTEIQSRFLDNNLAKHHFVEAAGRLLREDNDGDRTERIDIIG